MVYLARIEDAARAVKRFTSRAHVCSGREDPTTTLLLSLATSTMTLLCNPYALSLSNNIVWFALTMSENQLAPRPTLVSHISDVPHLTRDAIVAPLVGGRVGHHVTEVAHGCLG